MKRNKDKCIVKKVHIQNRTEKCKVSEAHDPILKPFRENQMQIDQHLLTFELKVKKQMGNIKINQYGDFKAAACSSFQSDKFLLFLYFS